MMPCSARSSRASLDDSVGGAPADEGDVGVGGAEELRRRDGGCDAGHLAHAFFHHGAALVWLVYSSLMRTPFSSCSSLETTWVKPGMPGMARGETPLSVMW